VEERGEAVIAAGIHRGARGDELPHQLDVVADGRVMTRVLP
jgi:hypothetical protein